MNEYNGYLCLVVHIHTSLYLGKRHSILLMIISLLPNETQHSSLSRPGNETESACEMEGEDEDDSEI